MVFHGILSENKNITIDITMGTEGTTMVFKNIKMCIYLFYIYICLILKGEVKFPKTHSKFS